MLKVWDDSDVFTMSVKSTLSKNTQHTDGKSKILLGILYT